MKHLKAKYFLFPFTDPVSKPKIIIGIPANLDNGIRAIQEEGAVR